MQKKIGKILRKERKGEDLGKWCKEVPKLICLFFYLLELALPSNTKTWN